MTFVSLGVFGVDGVDMNSLVEGIWREVGVRTLLISLRTQDTGQIIFFLK